MNKFMRVFSFFAFVALLSACSDDNSGFVTGENASIAVTPSAIEFSQVQLGQSAYLNVTVRHTGTSGTIILSPIRLTTESDDLSIELVEKSRIKPGEQARIQLKYTASDELADQGVLTIGHNLAGNPKTEIPISTPGLTAAFAASPASLNFGVVKGGDSATQRVTVLNTGLASATLTGAEVIDDDDGDFSVTIDSDREPIFPGETQYFEVNYAPTNKNRDRATLKILTDRDDVNFIITAVGEEETPFLVTDPQVMQLGWVEPGNLIARELAFRNEGNAELIVDSIALVDNHPALSLTLESGLLPTSLPADAGERVAVYFAPDEEVAMTGEPLGLIEFYSNSPQSPIVVPVYGAAGTPSIRFTPPDVVDFGYVDEDLKAKRWVTAYNVGQAPVTITGLELVDATSDEFELVTTESDITISPGGSFDLELSFENRQGPIGQEFAKLLISTDDPIVQTYPIDVTARRSEKSICDPVFIPELLAFGATTPGSSLTATMRLANFGSGPCRYDSYELKGCDPEGETGVPQFICDVDADASPYSIIGVPAPDQELAPGDYVEFDVEFLAPNVRDRDIGRDSYYGKLSALFFDPNQNTIVYATPPGGWGAGVNLRAESALGYLSIYPDVLDHGFVRTNCESGDSYFYAQATGPVAIEIQSMELSGDCEPFSLTHSPPVTVDGFSTITIGSIYSPIASTPDAEMDECTVTITTNADNLPTTTVTLLGHSQDISHQTEVFESAPFEKVDVLFVIDDSGSMGDDQQRLRDAFPIMVDLATSWGQDYHIGVVTTDTVLKAGRLQGWPPVADNTVSAENIALRMLVGVNGFYEEMGLEAAWLALTKRLEVSDIACDPNQTLACPADRDGVARRCVDGYCAGYNSGFLRDDAELVIVIVSDEEDASPRPIDFYIQELAGLKINHPGTGLRVHSFVTPSSGCNGFGSPGVRYMSVSNAFSGHIASICAADFQAEVDDIAEATFGLQDRFYLNYPPVAESITVTINDQVCSDWSYSYDLDSVIFTADGDCDQANELGASVQIDYDINCETRP